MASVQDLFETIGSAMVIAKQIEARDPARNSAEATASKNIFKHVREACTQLGNMVGLTVRGVEATNQLASEFNHLLDALNPPG
jgi:hypothetical protein